MTQEILSLIAKLASADPQAGALVEAWRDECRDDDKRRAALVALGRIKLFVGTLHDLLEDENG